MLVSHSIEWVWSSLRLRVTLCRAVVVKLEYGRIFTISGSLIYHNASGLYGFSDSINRMKNAPCCLDELEDFEGFIFHPEDEPRGMIPAQGASSDSYPNSIAWWIASFRYWCFVIVMMQKNNMWIKHLPLLFSLCCRDSGTLVTFKGLPHAKRWWKDWKTLVMLGAFTYKILKTFFKLKMLREINILCSVSRIELTLFSH